MEGRRPVHPPLETLKAPRKSAVVSGGRTPRWLDSLDSMTVNSAQGARFWGVRGVQAPPYRTSMRQIRGALTDPDSQSAGLSSEYVMVGSPPFQRFIASACRGLLVAGILQWQSNSTVK